MSGRFARLGLLASLVLVLAGCEDRRESAAAPAHVEDGIALREPSLKFLAIEPVGDSRSGVTTVVPGRLVMRPHAVASIGAPSAGRVASVRVRPGESVAAGKVLYTLQSPEAAAARAAVSQAVARAAAAEDALRRHTEMVAKGVGLELERFEAETRASEARAELERARRTVALLGPGEGDLIAVRAPRAGTVLAVNAALGAMVAPGNEALVEIGDTSRLWAVADIAERETGLLPKGHPVVVSVPSARKQLHGVVDGRGARIDPETRRLPVYIELKGDTAGLAPGTHIDLQFESGVPTLTVPVAAVLIKNGKQRVVYVQRPDGRFEARDVRTGAVNGGRVAIVEGLAPGERVVVKGALLLDGEAEQLL